MTSAPWQADVSVSSEVSEDNAVFLLLGSRRSGLVWLLWLLSRLCLGYTTGVGQMLRDTSGIMHLIKLREEPLECSDLGLVRLTGVATTVSLKH